MSLLEQVRGEVIAFEGTGSAIDQLRVTVEGIGTGLLLHNPAGMGADSGAEGAIEKGKRKFDAKEDAERAAYRLADGQLAIPGSHFRGALLNASKGIRPKGKKGSLKTVFAHIVVDEDLIGLTDHAGRPIHDYEIDSQRAIIQRQGIIRSRPKIKFWRAAVTFNFESSILGSGASGLITMVLADAGNSQGVGDFRPNKGGPYGRFRVVDYTLL
jgi:hypothetical protein